MSGKLERPEGQPNIKDIFKKQGKPQIKKLLTKSSTVGQQSPVHAGYPPFTTSASAKKRMLPSTERPSPKKQQTEITSSSDMSTSEEGKTPSVAKEISFQGFSAEFVRFGATMKELLQPMREDIQWLVEAQNLNTTATEICNEVKNDQVALKAKCEKVENENMELKNRLLCLENKMLQNNLIIHGIKEEEWELDDNRKEKIHHAIASTVDAPDYRKHLKIAKSIAIVKSSRIGKFRTGGCRPISVCFEKKSHAETLFQCKKHLPKGIYVDREYTEETERSRKLLRLILKLAKGKEEYSGKCKIEEDILVIHGKKYTTKNLHKLPSDINRFKASSKESDTVLAFFGELNPFSNFNISPFTLEGQNYHSSEQFI